MAVITLGELRGYWKRVSDWISGATTDAPKVTLSGRNALAYESITVSTVAVGFTPATYGAAVEAIITVENASIRFRIDGTAPTATDGHVADPGDTIVLTSAANIAAFLAIRKDSTDAKLCVTYLGG